MILNDRGKKYMNEVNKTLFIPLYGKSKVSKQKIILDDPTAEKIWAEESFKLSGKSKSKWLAYNMAMRARVFDDWTDSMLSAEEDSIVLHIGCGLDSRCRRIKHPYTKWLDCDFSDVISVRKNYYQESENYKMQVLDASDSSKIKNLPDCKNAIVVLEGISMYLSHEQLHYLFLALQEKYPQVHILLDVYTEFGVRASKFKNPVNDVGVTKLYGIDDIQSLLNGLKISFKEEHSITPTRLVNELKFFDRIFFKLLFTGKFYRKIYRLFELSCN